MNEETLNLLKLLERIRQKDNLTLIQCVRRYNFVARTA